MSYGNNKPETNRMVYINDSEVAETAQICMGNNNAIGVNSENNALTLSTAQEDEFERNNTTVEMDRYIEEIDNVEVYEISNEFDENEDWEESIYKKYIKLLKKRVEKEISDRCHALE